MGLEPDLESSSPFQLPLPPLPKPQHRRAPVLESGILSEGEDFGSRSPSVWTAPSPSQKRRARSPSLPSLPAPPSREAFGRTHTPARQQKSESSDYYTALWGSPYQLPPSSRATGRGSLDRSRSNSSVADHSPLSAPRIDRSERHSPVPEDNSESPRLSYASRSLVNALASSKDDNDIEYPQSVLPEDWIRKLAEKKKQNRHWLSDDSGASDSGSEDEFDEAWLDPGNKTPKAKPKRRLRGSESVISELRTLVKHRRGQPSDATITQQDFDNILRTYQSKNPQLLKMSASETQTTAVENGASNAEKPLPAPPQEQTTTESSSIQMSAPIFEESHSPNDRLQTVKRPSLSSTASFQRPKKRVAWRGKTCLIALPLENGKDEDGQPKKYLQPREVQEIFDSWKMKGFDIGGFNLSDGTFGDHQGQSRNIFPDLTEARKDIYDKNFRVSIPDTKAWDNYKKELQEQKLRALGVSFGDDPPARSSPTPSNPMSRQASQSSMVPSHPGAPQSSNGFRNPLENGFSPPFPAQANPFVRPQSIMSPELPQGPPAGFHFPRQSMAFAPGQTFNNMAVPLQSASPALSGPLSQQLSSHPTSRGVSPFIDGRRQSIRQTQSPITTLQETDDETYYQGQSNLLPHLRPSEPKGPKVQQQSPSTHNGLQPLQESNESEILEPARFTSHPDIASPMPQGHSHRHNVSESLQREIDDAEDHLEEQIQRQLEDEEKGDQFAKKDKESESEPLISLATDEEMPMDGSKGDSKNDTMEVQTNPSSTSSSKPRTVPAQKPPASTVRSNHSSKSSVSKLNVNAPEFVFDPTKSFTPSGMFNFGTTANFGIPAMENQTSGPGFTSQGAHSKTGSNISSFSGSFNASAPAFTPQMNQSAYKIQSSQQTFNVPRRDFSFSSKMPTFYGGATDFTPDSGLGISGTNTTENVAREQNAPKIFKVNLSDISKPAKKSKAIPIVKPPSDSEHESEDLDAEDGRIDRSESRMKRARRADGSGDEIPRFAAPSREISTEPQPRSSSVHRRTRSISITNDNRIPSPQAANGQLKELLDGLKSPGESAEMTSIRDKTRQDVPSNIEQTGTPALTENAAKGNEMPGVKSEEKKKSSLSAMAKSFSFNPGAGAFQPGLPTEIPSFEVESAPAAKLETKQEKAEPPVPAPAQGKPAKNPFSLGLGASRFAKSPPKRSPSPEPEEKPDEADKQLQNRIMNGVSYVDPSYQEIDDVMKELNGDDSDIGVERNPAENWRSPARSIGSVPKHNATAPEHYDTSKSESLQAKPHELVTTSPNKLQHPFQYLPQEESASSDSLAREIVAKNARFSPSYRPTKTNGDQDSPINRLNSAEQVDISDWNDVVDSADEDKFLYRTAFFDSRINDLVSEVIDKRLIPLEKGLTKINNVLTQLSSRSGSRRYRRSVSAEIEDSDADDEDDITQSRAISPLKDRKFEKLKASIFESIGAQKLVPSQEEFGKITQSLAELKTAIHERAQSAGPQLNGPSRDEFAELHKTIADLKTSLSEKQSQTIQLPTQSQEATDQLKETIKELEEFRTSVKEQQGGESVSEIKKTIEESISRAMRGKSAPVASTQEAATSGKLQLQVDGLESKLKVAESRAEEELKLRRQVEDTLADVQRSLKTAQADAAKYRESAEETEDSLKSFLNGQQEAKQHSAMLEEVNAAREKTISDLSDKTAALEDTLEEYRRSYQEKKAELEEAKAHMKGLDEENQNLDRTIHEMKQELQDGVQAKKLLKDKFDLLQEEMSKTAQNIAKDQSAWRHKEEEHKAKHDLLKARLEAEARTRERLEMEIDRLEKQEKDAMKARFLVEQIRGENNHLVGMVNELRSKHHEAEEQILKFKRELHNSEEQNRHEVQRILNSTKADVAAANQQVNILRANLESVIERLETQVESMKAEAKESKHRYESLLEEASAAKANALREAAEAREAALQEHYRFHERTLDEAKTSHERALEELKTSQQRKFEELQASHEKTIEELQASHEKSILDLNASNKQTIQELEASQYKILETTNDDHNRAMTYFRKDHERALHAAMEDKRMMENYLNGRLTAADEQVAHLKDHISHLEERLDIAKSAAQAAAEAAKAARGQSPARNIRAATGGSVSAKGQNLPEKISPQALRESIMVLQEQLHQRESQIEDLENELSEVDKDAPNKLKEKEVEINWLRELLGVRLDDLQDIIQTLSMPLYDRDAVRDAAIRLKANLQMVQQEKERAMTGGQRFPSLSQVAASPKSLPMAAAAAWGSWRKGQTSLGSLAEMAAPAGATVNTRSASQTPSKSSSPQSFLSGLLTPPASNVRQTPGPSSRVSSAPARRPLGTYPTTPKRQMSSNSQENRHALSHLPLPETPALLRGDSYDQDAESGHYSLDRYVNEDDDIASSMDGGANESDGGPASGAAAGINDEPFGPTIELAG